MAHPGSVVVTGASTGIGWAVSLRLAELGYRVFAGVRKEADGESLRQEAAGQLYPLILDVTDAASITAAAAQVAVAVGGTGLAGLVNNAGIAITGPLEFLPIAEFRREMEVNVTGQVAVTQAFLPLLRKRRGRIINIGSISGLSTVPMFGPYCASKYAMEAVSDALRMELAPFGVRVALLEPSSIATPIWSKSLTEADRLSSMMPPGAEALYGKQIAAVRNLAADASRTAAPVETVVKAVLHALTARRPKTRYLVGSKVPLRFILGLLPDRLKDRLILGQLRRLGKQSAATLPEPASGSKVVAE